jgi:hypothetical protein
MISSSTVRTAGSGISHAGSIKRSGHRVIGPSSRRFTVSRAHRGRVFRCDSHHSSGAVLDEMERDERGARLDKLSCTPANFVVARIWHCTLVGR